MGLFRRDFKYHAEFDWNGKHGTMDDYGVAGRLLSLMVISNNIKAMICQKYPGATNIDVDIKMM